VAALLLVTACSSHKNTAKSRWWHSFNARYNTYYNGSLAFTDGMIEKENGNKDNFTEMIPLDAVANKSSRELGRSNFDRAIEKSEKAIKLHSIKRRPEWTKNRRKTAKDIEWLNRREYNPFLWKAWLMLGKSQYQKGNFDEAAATFSYMSRLYATQPEINGIARAWLARSYTSLDWLYDAEDVIMKMRRDTMHYRAVKDWDYAYAGFYVRSHRYEEAAAYLAKAIRHERRKKQKARMWYLMGQLQTELGNRESAYKAYSRVVRQSPPYEVEFNARIAQTEVMAGGRSRQMIRRLRRMAASDNNKDYLDQVYYAIGNIYLADRDTLNAIAAYEKGNEKSVRNGIEKGVLLLKLGNLYWTREKYNDAQRCYGEAIGLLDKERADYDELSARSKVLDELVPFTDAVYLQDSLQVLAGLPEDERNAAIDRVIEALKKKEKEEKRAAEEAEADKRQAAQAALGNRFGNNRTTGANTAAAGKSGTWYFYNTMAVNQGKTAFQQQWGKRENVDDWQRANRTVVNLAGGEGAESEDLAGDSVSVNGSEVSSDVAAGENVEGSDSVATDPHTREYYLAQIPFTDEQKAESDNIIKDGLFNSGVIFKDKLDNLPLGEKALKRLTEQYADYEKNDEAWYHLFLLYSRMGRHDIAARCLSRMQADYPESQWTVLLSDPYFAENALFGVHIEDSLYAATYDAFKADRYDEVAANTRLSAERFPMGANRAKFIFIDGLSRLNEGDATACVKSMKEVVEKYPDSDVSEMAGMIIKGVQAGRALYGGKFDIGDIWSRRGADMAADSTITDTLSMERNTGFVFLLAYRADSLNSNQLLFEMARYNFSNFMVRNFDITVDVDNGISRMLISGFLNYDEALQYARQLYADAAMAERLKGCRRIIISEENLKMLGTRYSYVDYEDFFEKSFAPLQISNEELLNIPEGVEVPEGEVNLPAGIEVPAPGQPSTTDDDDGLGLGDTPQAPVQQPSTTDDDDGLGLGDTPQAPVQQPSTTDDDDDGLGFGDTPQTPTEDNNSINNEPQTGGFDFDDDFYR
jgi:tetratricopeptide (TPR) repeat protein